MFNERIEKWPRSTQEEIVESAPAARSDHLYDVEIGDAIKTRLRRLLGVLGDYSGQPKTPLPKLKERKFVDVDPRQL